MNNPWYTSRFVTRTLGIAGCLVMLVASCQRVVTLGARSSCRGDLLVSYGFSAPVFSTDSQKVFGVINHATPGKSSQTLEAWETAHGRRLWRQALSTDGLALATHDDRVATMTFRELAVRDSRTGRVVWQNVRPDPLSEQACLSFSPSGRLLALSLSGSIEVFDATTGKALKEINFVNGDYRRLPVFLSDGALVAAQSVQVPNSLDRVTIVVVMDPFTGKVRRRLARDVEDWSVSPDGARVLIKRRQELLLLRSTGAPLATVSPGKYFDHYADAEFIPGSTNILLTGQTADYLPAPSRLWNPSQRVVRPAHADEELHAQEYSRDGSKALLVEDMGGLGRHKPLGTVLDRKTDKAPVYLEGMTGWELK